MNNEAVQMLKTPKDFWLLCEDDENTSFAHVSATTELWIEILEIYPVLSRCVAANKTIPDQVIELLSKSDDMNVRLKIATKRKLNRTVFERLANDPDPNIRDRIAYNPKVPNDILEKLCKDSDPIVACSAKRKLVTER
ncbi:hypothetical protein ACIQUF_03390 [Pseudomonas sp. NPDC090233]|uniref:hypothetical protein n=1 Tax=Pseudomonas sp. NPDC090233 TaxID=3364479 RepID=UPI00383BE95C